MESEHRGMEDEIVDERKKRDDDIREVCGISLPTPLHPETEKQSNRGRIGATDDRQQKKERESIG